MQFSLVDPNNKDASSQQIFSKLVGITDQADQELNSMEDLSLTRTDTSDIDEEETDAAIDEEDEAEDAGTPDAAQKKRRKLRLAKIRRKAKQRAFEFSGGSDVAGVLFLEVSKIIDLPPEKARESPPPPKC